MDNSEKRILIVEDDNLLAATFEMFIKQLGYSHYGTAKSSIQATELCHFDKPDIVLMDIHLDGNSNGIEAARSLGENYNLPVVYITGDDTIDMVRNAVLSNTYGFLAKPLHKNILERTIEFALKKHSIDTKLRS